ncbi:hypothetical protein LCGC14_1504640 [marine sediment metagenome]|uniref:Uncharacterized protein n=1 Tax=marine sediment metagenome TaxID=412755 RepID=A0A0F9M4E4_9ZZZZ
MNRADGTNGWTGKFVLGGFVAVTATLTGVFANSMSADQKHLELKQAEHGERLSALESFNKGVSQDLQRIDRNVDRILERITR